MRRLVLVTLLVIGLLATPLAFAAPPEGKHVGKGRHAEASPHHATTTNATSTNTTSNDTAPAEPAKVKREDHRSIFAALRAHLASLRATWLSSKASVQDACHADKPADNATKEERLEHAHCIRDGFREHRVSYQANRTAAREGARPISGGA